MDRQVEVTTWPSDRPATREQAMMVAAQGGETGATWSNGPGDRYSPHQHAYDKMLVVLEGSIEFRLPQASRTYALKAGDRMLLPAGTVHSALVGDQGVVCWEAHLP